MPYGYGAGKMELKGCYDDGVDYEELIEIGTALAAGMLASGKQKAVIGRDASVHAKKIWRIVVDELLNAGISVMDVGVVVMPVLNYSSQIVGVPVTIMISGRADSPHHSVQINGIDAVSQRAICRGASERQGAAVKGNYRSCDCMTLYQSMLEEKLERFNAPLRIAVSAPSDIELSFVQDVIRLMGGEPVCDEQPDAVADDPDNALKRLKACIYRESCDMGVLVSQNGAQLDLLNVSGIHVMLGMNGIALDNSLSDLFCFMGSALKIMEAFPFTTALEFCGDGNFLLASQSVSEAVG